MAVGGCLALALTGTLLGFPGSGVRSEFVGPTPISSDNQFWYCVAGCTATIIVGLLLAVFSSHRS